MSKKLPSVSKIISIISYFGLKDVPEHILATSKEKGNRIHNWIQAKITNEELPSLSREDLPYLKAFALFMKENPEHKQTILKSKVEDKFSTDDYQGRFDFYNKENNTIFELKTTSSITLSHKLQLMAYARAKETEEAYLLSLKKDGKYKLLKITDLEDNIGIVWGMLVSLYQISQKRGYSALKPIFETKV